MRTSFRLDNPDEMEATMTLSMPLKEWKQLKEQIGAPRWPSCDFAIAITELIYEASRSFHKNCDLQKGCTDE